MTGLCVVSSPRGLGQKAATNGDKLHRTVCRLFLLRDLRKLLVIVTATHTYAIDVTATSTSTASYLGSSQSPTTSTIPINVTNPSPTAQALAASTGISTTWVGYAAIGGACAAAVLVLSLSLVCCLWLRRRPRSNASTLDTSLTPPDGVVEWDTRQHNLHLEQEQRSGQYAAPPSPARSEAKRTVSSLGASRRSLAFGSPPLDTVILAGRGAGASGADDGSSDGASDGGDSVSEADLVASDDPPDPAPAPSSVVDFGIVGVDEDRPDVASLGATRRASAIVRPGGQAGPLESARDRDAGGGGDTQRSVLLPGTPDVPAPNSAVCNYSGIDADASLRMAPGTRRALPAAAFGLRAAPSRRMTLSDALEAEVGRLGLSSTTAAPTAPASARRRSAGAIPSPQQSFLASRRAPLGVSFSDVSGGSPARRMGGTGLDFVSRRRTGLADFATALLSVAQEQGGAPEPSPTQPAPSRDAGSLTRGVKSFTRRDVSAGLGGTWSPASGGQQLAATPEVAPLPAAGQTWASVLGSRRDVFGSRRLSSGF